MDQKSAKHALPKITTPFSYDETIHLIVTIEEEPSIISKKTDRATMVAKLAAWERVWRKFNLGKFSRDIFALKEKWDSLEREARARSFALKRSMRRSAFSVQDLILDKVEEITTNKYSDLLSELDEATYENCEIMLKEAKRYYENSQEEANRNCLNILNDRKDVHHASVVIIGDDSDAIDSSDSPSASAKEEATSSK